MDFHHQTRDSSTSFLPPFSVESGWRCWRCWFNQSLICDSADMFFWACENQLLPCLNHCGWIGWSSDLASLLTTWFPPNMCCFFPWLDLSMAHFLGAGISWKKKQVLQRVATRWSEVWERTARKTPGLQQGVVEPQLGWWGRLRFLLFSVFLAEMPSPGTSSDRLSNQVTSWHDQSVGITKMIQNGPNRGWTPWQTHRNYSCLCGPSEYWCGDSHDSQQDKVNT